MYIMTKDGWRAINTANCIKPRDDGDFGTGNPYRDRWNAMTYDEKYVEQVKMYIHKPEPMPVMRQYMMNGVLHTVFK